MMPHPMLAEERALAVLAPASLQHLPLLKRDLSQVFPRLNVIAPRDIQHLHQVVKRSRRTHRVLLAVGGDGTFHQVLQSADVAAQVLGLLPSGSGNDLARSLNFPRGLRRSIAHLLTLTPRPIDFGTACGIRFHTCAGFGLDSASLRLRQSRLGLLRRNYIAAYLLALVRLTCPALEITYDDQQLAGRFYWVLAMNAPFIGGGIRIAPQAKLNDGLLDMVLVKQTSKLNMLCLTPRAIRGKHLSRPEVVFAQISAMSCVSETALDYLAVDGELHYVGERKVNFTVHPGGMALLS